MGQSTNFRQSGAEVDWRGHSGRHYALRAEQIDTFSLTDADLFVLADHDTARWVGSASDVISDSESRNGFRDALKACSIVLRLESSTLDNVEKLITAFDLLHGHGAEHLKLVSAS